MGRIVFALPILLVLMAIGVYFILIPKIYGETISVIDLLIADSNKIISMLRTGNMGLPKIRGIFVLEIFWRVWFVLFVASLFFVGKRLQNPEKKFSENARMIKNDPYLAVQDALDRLKRNDISDELEEVIDSVKKLSDKLYYESDFGIGDPNVVDCENEIAESLENLVLGAKNFQNGDSEENIKKLKDIVNKINSLLNVRSNLEKRQ